MGCHLRIALFGRSGSGKTSVADYLAREHGFLHVSTGRLCRKIALLLFNSERRKILNALSSKVREIEVNAWTKAVLRDASTDRIVFESIRYLDDVAFLRSQGFVIWHVRCSLSVCRERLQHRGQTFEIADLHHPMEASLNDLTFDATIENGDVSLQDLFAQVNQALVNIDD